MDTALDLPQTPPQVQPREGTGGTEKDHSGHAMGYARGEATRDRSWPHKNTNRHKEIGNRKCYELQKAPSLRSNGQ